MTLLIPRKSLTIKTIILSLLSLQKKVLKITALIYTPKHCPTYPLCKTCYFSCSYLPFWDYLTIMFSEVLAICGTIGSELGVADHTFIFRLSEIA